MKPLEWKWKYPGGGRKLKFVCKGCVVPGRQLLEASRRQVDRSQHVHLLEPSDKQRGRVGAERRPWRRGGILSTFRLLLFQSGLKKLLAYLFIFVHCVIWMEGNHWSLISFKVLNMTLGEVTYPKSGHYTAAFVLKGLCHPEGSFSVLFSELETGLFNDCIHSLGDDSVFGFLANGRLAGQHAPSCWEIWRTQKCCFLSLQNVWALWRPVFWTSGVYFARVCFTHLFSNLEVGSFFQMLPWE